MIHDLFNSELRLCKGHIIPSISKSYNITITKKVVQFFYRVFYDYYKKHFQLTLICKDFERGENMQ